MVSLILKKISYRFEGVSGYLVLEAENKEEKERGGGDSRESYRYESCMLLPFYFVLVFAFDVCSLVLEH